MVCHVPISLPLFRQQEHLLEALGQVVELSLRIITLVSSEFAERILEGTAAHVLDAVTGLLELLHCTLR